VVQALGVGYYHTCVLLTNGQVKCWGRNDDGQLGLGDTIDRGDGPGEMGANLPFVDLGPGALVLEVDAGYYHTCALLTDGAVTCWGDNFYSQLGLGDTSDRGDGPSEMGANLTAVPILA
jgi:alpha-tubulin suppressor-like RCC1 family protein